MSSKIEAENVIHITRQWLEAFVIQHNLCPFAKHHLDQNTIKFVVSNADTEAKLLTALEAMLTELRNDDSIETALLIHPHVLSDFASYNQFLGLVDDLIELMSEVGNFQVASFHPAYQFADTLSTDAENYTNRSPFPMLHVLREGSVAKALKYYANPSQIPLDNIDKMNAIGEQVLEADFNQLLTRVK